MADHEVVELMFLRRQNKANSRTGTSDFRRADFGVFREESHEPTP